MKWIAEEEHSAAALRLLRPDSELLMPDFGLGEVANALVKNVRRGEIAAEDVAPAIERVGGECALLESSGLLAAAVEIALGYGRSVFHSLYLALAYDSSCQYVTADRRAYDALSGSFAANLLWVEDIPVGA